MFLAVAEIFRIKVITTSKILNVLNDFLTSIKDLENFNALNDFKNFKYHQRFQKF